MKHKTKQTIKKSLVGLCVFTAIVIISNMSFADATAQQSRYCEMVKAGNWPNYSPDIKCDEEIDNDE